MGAADGGGASSASTRIVAATPLDARDEASPPPIAFLIRSDRLAGIEPRQASAASPSAAHSATAASVASARTSTVGSSSSQRSEASSGSSALPAAGCSASA